MRFRAPTLLLAGTLVLAHLLACSDNSSPRTGSPSSETAGEVDEPVLSTSRTEALTKAELDALERNPPTEGLYEKSATSRFGQLTVQRTGEDYEQVEQLYFGDAQLPLSERHVSVSQVFAIGRKDFVFVQLTPEGNWCGGDFVMLLLSAEGVSVSDKLGSCAGTIRVTDRNERLVVRLPTLAFFATQAGLTPTTIDEAEAEELEHKLDTAVRDYDNVMRPLVEPDAKLYHWCGILEQAEEGVYILQLGSQRFKFAALAGPGQVSGLSLRIGGQMCVTGMYTKNVPYSTVLGEPRTMPLLIAFRVSLN